MEAALEESRNRSESIRKKGVFSQYPSLPPIGHASLGAICHACGVLDKNNQPSRAKNLDLEKIPDIRPTPQVKLVANRLYNNEGVTSSRGVQFGAKDIRNPQYWRKLRENLHAEFGSSDNLEQSAKKPMLPNIVEQVMQTKRAFNRANGFDAQARDEAEAHSQPVFRDLPEERKVEMISLVKTHSIAREIRNKRSNTVSDGCPDEERREDPCNTQMKITQAYQGSNEKRYENVLARFSWSSQFYEVLSSIHNNEEC